jgi:citrate lyase subunit beta / citryl-CoA lyase
MSKPYSGNWVIRTMLFTPGHVEKLIPKSANSKADVVVLDLEDAVPPKSKIEARQTIRRVLEEGVFADKTVMVRINPMDTGLTLLDLDAVACKQLNGFIFPKPYTSDDIKAFDAQLSLKEKTLGLKSGHFEIVVLIETALGVLNAYEIATATPRIIGLLFGSEDYLAEIQGLHSENATSLLTARSIVAIASRAAGIVPIDTPFVDVHNEDGFAKHLQQGRELGFDGLLVMTPSQIDSARDVYTPDREEVAWAEEIVHLADEARADGRGIAIYEGKFISPPTEKRARAVLNRYHQIANFEDYFRNHS